MYETVKDSRALICVYRQRNAATVRRLLDSNAVAANDWHVRLWALDEISEDLADVTVGRGPGPKFDLCNRLLMGVDASYTVIADDDVNCTGLDRAIDIMHRLGIDLAQPAHSWNSNSTYRFCRRRPWASARRTNFIEIGPLFIVGPRHRSAVLPFPADIGMGWGLEFEWYEQSLATGLSIGIVDSVTMQHLGTLGADYDMALEGRQLRRKLDEHSVGKVEEFHRTLHTFSRFTAV